jgi:hypothetical protein
MTHYRFSHAFRMEWIKLTSLRSMIIAPVATIAAMTAIGFAVGAGTKNSTPELTDNLLAGVAIGQLMIGVLGVLMMTGEYSSGAIRSTLAAIPNRPLVLVAKSAVFALVALVISEVAVFADFLVGRAALRDTVVAPSLGSPNVLRAVLMSGAYLCLIGLMGLGLGAIVRHSGAGIAALVGGVFVIPQVIVAFSQSVSGPVVKYLPMMIGGNSLAEDHPVPRMLSPWAGIAVLCLYAAIALGLGGWQLSRRDA